MKITLQYFDSCPNWNVTDEHIKSVVSANGLNVEMQYQLIESPGDAEEYSFHGSPTMLVDGVDPFATEDTQVGFACRIYFTDSGQTDAPSVEQIAHALGM